MLQGSDIPWGVMVDTWDLTFSSTSDVPDRLDLCPNQNKKCHQKIGVAENLGWNIPF